MQREIWRLAITQGTLGNSSCPQMLVLLVLSSFKHEVQWAARTLFSNTWRHRGPTSLTILLVRGVIVESLCPLWQYVKHTASRGLLHTLPCHWQHVLSYRLYRCTREALSWYFSILCRWCMALDRQRQQVEVSPLPKIKNQQKCISSTSLA